MGLQTPKLGGFAIADSETLDIYEPNFLHRASKRLKVVDKLMVPISKKIVDHKGIIGTRDIR